MKYNCSLIYVITKGNVIPSYPPNVAPNGTICSTNHRDGPYM